MALSKIRSNKSSRSSSLLSLINGAREEDIPPPIHINVNVANEENNDDLINAADEINPADLDSDPAQNADIQLNFTRNHPLGRILWGLLQDNVKIAGKTNLNAMETNGAELCRNFYNAMMLDKNKMNRKIWQATADIEANMIHKELNSHIINQNVEPPTNFSPVPTLLTPRQRVECLKLFPSGSQKFSGQNRDGSMDILEYLSIIKAAQAQCNLSESEFKEMLLASTTGKAHVLIAAWINLEEDPASIFHNLLLHYDKRETPEEARMKLYTYKAPKYSNLNEVEAHIMHLARRAVDNLPQGPSRKAAYQMEFIQGLVRSLPPHSAMEIQSINNNLSARLGRAATAVEISRALNAIKHSIDMDIKNNGQDTMRKFGSNIKTPYKGSNRITRHSAYALTRGNNTHGTNTAQYAPNRGNNIHGTNTAQYAPRRPNQGLGYNPSQMRQSRPYQTRQFTMRTNYNGTGANNYAAPQFQRISNPNRMPLGNNKRAQNNTQINYCSLCGKKDHTVKDGCPNMVDDNGDQVQCFPSHGTCQICPEKVSPRLNHNAVYCPYRKGGPFNNKL